MTSSCLKLEKTLALINSGFKYTLVLLLSIAINSKTYAQSAAVQPGAWNTAAYFNLLKNKKIAIVANQTSTIGKVHLVDSLKNAGMQILKVFAPEHGFRGEAANGEKVASTIDKKTGLALVSLYGTKVKPSATDLLGVDVVVFDIQDVGVRFYTYLSTLHYVMQACVENKKKLIVLDRPNPNANYVDGPILEKGMESMVGLHPIPLVHGMTLGELAKMINGEKWLKLKDTCMLTIIEVSNWNRSIFYELPIAPSPNLPTSAAIIAYPTLGLFEGTEMSMGRGTEKPFECFGAPWFKDGNYEFIPKNIPGKATNPPFLNQTCRGVLISDFSKNYLSTNKHIYIDWLVMLYKECPDTSKFFNSFFNKLAGTPKLMQQIKSGKTAEEIKKSWEPGVTLFLEKRKRYLLYTDK